MAENETTGEQENAQQFAMQRIYVKDISFETPNVPGIFTEKWEPNTKVDLNSTATKLGEGFYEVVLALTVTTTVGDKTAYLVEVQQAGIFALSGFNEDDLGGLLGSYCPNVLFPFAREVVADLVSKGSFPQLLLAPINFDALYAQHLEQQKQQGEGDKPVH